MNVAIGQQDSAQTQLPINVTEPALTDSLSVVVDTQTVVWPEDFRDKLIRTIGLAAPKRPRIDLPQVTSWWKFNPLLARNSVTPWGDFESFYPAGLAATHLSRYDAGLGEMTFANPVPLPQSEEFVHTEIADEEHWLSPGLASVVAPFGRPFAIYQVLEPENTDSARSKIFVTRGRGAFANTTFRFQNYFGPLGRVAADGSFQKTDGLYFNANTNMQRMRFSATPAVGRRARLELLYAFNRLKGDRLIFPPDYDYSGFSTDNMSIYAARGQLLVSPRSSYSASLAYKTASQKFDSPSLGTSQSTKVVDLRLANQRPSERHALEFAIDARYLHLVDQEVGESAVYYSVGASDIVMLSASSSALARAAVVGSSDLSPRLSLTLALTKAISEPVSLVAAVAHTAVLPGAEMQYGIAKSAGFETDTVDYSLVPDIEIETGSVTGGDLGLQTRSEKVEWRIRTGYYWMRDIPEWNADFDSLRYGEFAASGIDQDLWFATLESRWQPHDRVSAMLNYGFRQVTASDSTVTLGPAHTVAALVLYKLPVRRFQVDLSFGLGAKFRSATDRHFIGDPEDGVLTLDSYFTFDLKSFHFFFNFENLLDTEYTVAGLDQLGRSVWWGFNWAFLD